MSEPTVYGYCVENRIRPDKAMDALQENGIISDECIFITDVPAADQLKAIEWLKANPL